MTREEAIAKLKELKADDDAEIVHIKADGVLCALLRVLGYDDVVEAWDEVQKWYS